MPWGLFDIVIMGLVQELIIHRERELGMCGTLLDLF